MLAKSSEIGKGVGGGVNFVLDILEDQKMDMNHGFEMNGPSLMVFKKG